jgi:hypothetical protein
VGVVVAHSTVKLARYLHFVDLMSLAAQSVATKSNHTSLTNTPDVAVIIDGAGSLHLKFAISFPSVVGVAGWPWVRDSMGLLALCAASPSTSNTSPRICGRITFFLHIPHTRHTAL